SNEIMSKCQAQDSSSDVIDGEINTCNCPIDGYAVCKPHELRPPGRMHLLRLTGPHEFAENCRNGERLCGMSAGQCAVQRHRDDRMNSSRQLRGAPAGQRMFRSLRYIMSQARCSGQQLQSPLGALLAWISSEAQKSHRKVGLG